MVKQVTSFEAADGKTFDNLASAEAWEHRVNKARAIESVFPNNGHLSSGDFYRLPMPLIADARRKLVEILREDIGERYQNAIDYFEDGGRGGLVGRLLCDGGSPYYGVWWLFESIDDEGRMFDQPYFASHPSEAGDEIPY